jgi:hypothetical protein
MAEGALKETFVEGGFPKLILGWGSAGPRGSGRYEITVRESTGEICISEEDPMGGSEHYFLRGRARQMARAILAATEKKP